MLTLIMLCRYDMKLLVALVSRLFPDFQFGWLAEEMRRNLPLELDFVHEGHNCEKVAKCFGHLHFLKVRELSVVSVLQTLPFSDVFEPSFSHRFLFYLFIHLYDWTQ